MESVSSGLSSSPTTSSAKPVGDLFEDRAGIALVFLRRSAIWGGRWRL